MKTEMHQKPGMRRISKWLTRHSIVWQATLLFGIVIVIPTLLIASVFLTMLRQSSIQEADRNHRQYLLQMKRSIEENMQKAENLASQILFGQELQYFLKNDPPIRSQEKITFAINGLQGSLLNAKYTFPNLFYQTIVYTPNHGVDEVIGLIYHDDDVRQYEYYREFWQSAAKSQWGTIRRPNRWDSIPKVDKELTEPWILPYYVKIYTPYTAECVGVLEIDLLVEKLVDSGFLSDKNTELLFHLWGEDKQLYYSSKKQEQEEWASLRLPDGSGISDVWENGQKEHILYESVPKGSMQLAVSIPLKSLTKPLNAVTIVTVLVIAAGMGIVLLLSRLLAKNLFKRLTAMEPVIESMEKGNFSVRMDTQGEDEIAHMAHSFNHMASRISVMIETVVEEETARKDAELRALQAQINPHFLYNTLENMRMQCEIEGYYAISDALVSLAELLRYSIEKSDAPVSVGQELASLEHYLTVMRMRFSQHIVFRVDLPETLRQRQIPKMTLQPLIENAINHGFSARQPIFTICLRGHLEGEDTLILDIEDDGMGISAERLTFLQTQLQQGGDIVSSHRHSIGLSNVNRRIAMQYGPGSGIELTSIEGRGLCVRLILRNIE